MNSVPFKTLEASAWTLLIVNMWKSLLFPRDQTWAVFAGDITSKSELVPLTQFNFSVLSQQDVLAFYVAVNHVVGMQMWQTLRKAEEYLLR